MSGISADYLADAVSRDKLLATIYASIEVTADLRDNKTIRILMQAFHDDCWRAVLELAGTSPEDKVSITDLLVRIRAYVYIRGVLDAIRTRGEIAEQQIEAQDQRPGDE